MAVANAWATGHSAAPPRQFRRPSSSASETLNPLLRNKSSLNLPNRVLIRRSRNSDLSCRCSSISGNSEDSNSYSDCGGNSISSYSSSSLSSVDWDWNRWTRHFSEIEQAENYASLLKFQLEDAIDKEDFQEAIKLKTAIAETTSKDSIAEIMSELKNAIDEERYHDASRLCQSTGSGLVGWWVGYSKDSDDPFGRLVQITPGTGRFIGKCYSPRQLVTSSPGTPLFEIFVVKDAYEGYNLQVAFLNPIKGKSVNSSSSSVKPTKGPSVGETENAPVIDVKIEDSEVENDEGRSIDLEAAAEEGIKNVVNFLKEKIPELKVKVTRVDITEDTVKQFIEEDNENKTSGDIEEEANDIDSDDPDLVSAQGDSDTMEDGSSVDTKLVIGGVLHNRENSLTKEEFVRVPADIKSMDRNSFVLHIPKSNQNSDAEQIVAPQIKVAKISAQVVSELVPPEVAKALMGEKKLSPKVLRDVREMLKLAFNQAQRRNRLSEYTNFSRISTSNGDLDPFDGLYVGAFGPYGTEVVQLRRKYGNWNIHNEEKASDVEFFEYVEAVKLTGDLNVPAGQVTFRAKVGKGSRHANRGKYSPELGVVASYSGQGRIAEFGFRNPKWVEGELLQLDGKSFGSYVKGADLGFLYTIPDQSFLVLFNRLKLPE